MKSNEMVSVIVPIYNVEKYIGKCIQSILDQTYENIEVILVDDGTPDNSNEICDSYAEKDSKVKVVHKKNEGVSVARNTGLKLAKGKYIIFVDGDDWLEKDCVEYMVDLIESTETKMAMSLNNFTTRNRKQIENDKIEKWSTQKATEELLYGRPTIGCWNKIYNREFLINLNIQFDATLFQGEGLRFITDVSQHAKNVGIGRRKVYNYRLNNVNSACTKPTVERGVGALDSMKNIEKKMTLKNPEIQVAIKYHIWRDLRLVISGIVLTGSVKENKELYKECLSKYRREGLILFSANIPTKERLKAFLGWVTPMWCIKLWQVIKERRLSKDKVE